MIDSVRKSQREILDEYSLGHFNTKEEDILRKIFDDNGSRVITGCEAKNIYGKLLMSKGCEKKTDELLTRYFDKSSQAAK